MKRWIRRLLGACIGLGLLLVAGQTVLWWLFGGRLWVSKTTCPKGHLAMVGSCMGKSEPGWQNSGPYYLIASGQPRPEFCQSFMANYQQLDSALGKTCPAWSEVSCADYPAIAHWKCFACDRMAANGNTHYFLLAAISPDCSRGVYFSGSRYKPQDLREQIHFSP